MLPTQTQIIEYSQSQPGLIRKGTDIPKAEKNIVIGTTSNRNSIVTTSLINNFNINNSVRIAFCGSGGGDRAMLNTLGALIGAEKIGLLNTATYMASLSGSTWTQGLWLSSGQKINNLKAQLKENLQMPSLQIKDGLSGIPPIRKKEEILRLIKTLVTKTVFEQNVGPVDLWGALIANHIFRGVMEPRISLRMTKTQIPNIQSGSADVTSFPFPIYTAVSGDHINGYKWYEFTPIECGSSDIGYWCPTWAFGRKMENGVSTKWRTPTSPIRGSDYPPEQTLGFFLGICGSAFTINIGEILNMIDADIKQALENESAAFKKLANATLEYLKKSNVGTKSIHPATLHNYTYNIPGSPIKDQIEIQLRDAALHFNLPIPPLLRKERQIDLIFIFDASSNMLDNPGAELKVAQQWAISKNIPFPNLEKYPNLGKEAITIMDDNTQAPIIVYLPMYKDPKLKYEDSAKNFDLKKCLTSSCNTFNFTYNPNDFDGLTALSEQNITLNSEKIKTALHAAASRAHSNPWYQSTN